MLAALFLLFSTTAFADLSLEDLLRGFATIPEVQARFEERKSVTLLETPLFLQGTLTYRAPDYLRKQVDQPQHSLFELQGNQIRVIEGEIERSVPGDYYPAIRAFAEAFRATLAGDATTLARYYDIRLSGTQAAWELLLLPKTTILRDFVRSIRLMGSGNRIQSTEVLETTGDRSLMTVFFDER